MELLKYISKFRKASRLVGLSSILSISIFANASSATDEKNTFKTCFAHENFREAHNYLKTKKDLPLSEVKLIKAALLISKGCNGSASRFKKIYELLDKSGFDQKRSFELARDFAHLSDAQTDNFAVIFKGLFLENAFDMDFETSYMAAMAMSAYLPKDWNKVKADFSSFLKFCGKNKVEILPIKDCANWTLGLLKTSDKFPEGVYSSFEKINNYLLNRKGVQLPIKGRMILVGEILKNGPTAPDAFIKTLNWVNSKDGPQLPPQQAWKLAYEVAKNSQQEVLKIAPQEPILETK